MVNPPTKNDIRILLGDATVDSWNQEKVTQWLEEKGWGQFASTFEKHGICRERFFQITLAELVEYLPRTMTTYYERRRLLSEIRSLIPTTPGQQQKHTPSTPTNISINTNLHEYTRLGEQEGKGGERAKNTRTSQSPQSAIADHTTTRDSGIGYLSHYSAGSSSPSPSPSASPSSDHLIAPFSKKYNNSSPTRSSYSPKAAFHKIKNTFRSHAAPLNQMQTTTVIQPTHFNHQQQQQHPQQQNSASSSPRSARHESGDDDRGRRTSPAIPARVSSTPDKITKFWATYSNWHSSSPSSNNKKPSPSAYTHEYQPSQLKKPTDQRIQITGDKETWYSLNVTNMRDPVAIKQHILRRMQFSGDCDQYQYFHENGADPERPMDPQELMYLCSVADRSASQRILVKPAVVHNQAFNDFIFTLSTPELGKSPTDIPSNQSPSNTGNKGSPTFKPLCRKAARRPIPPQQQQYQQPQRVGIQLSDPPQMERCRSGSEPFVVLPAQPLWRRSEPDMENTLENSNHHNHNNNGASLWAVPPTQQQQQQQQLWAVTPHTNSTTTMATSNHDISNDLGQMQISSSRKPAAVNKPLPTPPLKKTSGAVFWGERPPAEVVFQHMEQFFDSKDLDKEVVVEPIKRHTKSIRVVAREASRKYKNNKMVRRKSTKVWGQRVVELKNRSQNVMARLPSVSEHMRLSHGHSNTKDESTDDTMQWIRGKLIGKGSFGRVYLAFNVGTGEVIAVKQVEIPKTASDILNEEQHDMVEALYQEIMTLRDLDHENIVQYLGYGQDNAEGVINIFLEYVSGGSVASRLALHGAFDEPLTKYFTRQICSGLAYLHSKHILHRDIKAANILVEADGICKISDFGLSKKNDYDEVYDQNSRMSLRGSIYWMAPEVVKNEPYSAKVDIWSLGCTMIEMLTGQRPWITLSQIAALYNLGRLNTPTIPENISECAKDFLRQCFIIDPLKRPTATDLLAHEFLSTDISFQFKDYVDKGKI
ncbi:mitogen-activated protein kinase kinase kinase [Mucor circinelloides]